MTEQVHHFLVSGQVQGVYFRAGTRERAIELGLRGWVRNLPDGRVEVLASGEAGALDALEQWLWDGPERAQVEQVSNQDADQRLLQTLPTEGFVIQRP